MTVWAFFTTRIDGCLVWHRVDAHPPERKRSSWRRVYAERASCCGIAVPRNRALIDYSPGSWGEECPGMHQQHERDTDNGKERQGSYSESPRLRTGHG